MFWAHPVAIFHGVSLPRNHHHWPSILLYGNVMQKTCNGITFITLVHPVSSWFLSFFCFMFLQTQSDRRRQAHLVWRMHKQMCLQFELNWGTWCLLLQRLPLVDFCIPVRYPSSSIKWPRMRYLAEEMRNKENSLSLLGSCLPNMLFLSCLLM